MTASDSALPREAHRPLFRFTIRDVLWLTVVVATGLGGWRWHYAVLALQRKVGQAQERVRAMRAAPADDMEAKDGERRKRAGQFGISDLFVLTTVAAVAFGIVQLPINPFQKMFALIGLWLGFTIWA